MAYRVDSGRRMHFQRRIGLCTLDQQLNVASGTVVPLSDTIQGGNPYHYDRAFYAIEIACSCTTTTTSRPGPIKSTWLTGCGHPGGQVARLQLTACARRSRRTGCFLNTTATSLPSIRLHRTRSSVLTWPEVGQSSARRLFFALGCWPVFRPLRHARRGGAPPVRCGDTYVSFLRCLWRPKMAGMLRVER